MPHLLSKPTILKLIAKAEVGRAIYEIDAYLWASEYQNERNLLYEFLMISYHFHLLKKNNGMVDFEKRISEEKKVIKQLFTFMDDYSDLFAAA